MLKGIGYKFVFFILIFFLGLLGFQIIQISRELTDLKLVQQELIDENKKLAEDVVDYYRENQRSIEGQKNDFLKVVEASYDEFRKNICEIETIVYHLDAYKTVTGYLLKSQTAPNKIEINEIEWITDKNRLSELNIDADMPNGFFVYDEMNVISTYNYNEQVRFNVLTGSAGTVVDENKFWSHIDALLTEGITPLVYLRIVDGTVVEIGEAYLP